MKVESTPEKDKLGEWTILVRMTNQDIINNKEYANDYSQKPDKDEHYVSAAKKDYAFYHEIWKTFNPS